MSTRIFLKRASARNFKGLENISFEFSGRETTLLGANGTGKSSFFAMFIWCLFGKDQFGRTDHQIKTLINGQTDRYKECEVELLLQVNDAEVTLKRVYAENWVRPKGGAEDVFKGNETKRYINDIEVKATEYDSYVKELCSEDIFRVITNPAYFPNLKEIEQRAILFKMVGDITDESVANGNTDFTEFLQMVSGKDFETFKKEISQRKKRLKDEVSSIPARIDELKRSFPEALNWIELEAQLEAKKQELATLESQINDLSKVSESVNQGRMAIQAEINTLEQANQAIQFKYQQEKNIQIEQKKVEIRGLYFQKANKSKDFNAKSSRLEFLNNRKESLTVKLKELGDRWRNTNKKELTFDPEAFECPTCKRALEPQDIEAKEAEMIASFNTKKAQQLKINEEEGKATKAELDSVNAEIASIGTVDQVDTSDLDIKIEQLQADLKDFESIPLQFSNDQEYKSNTAKIEQLKTNLTVPTTSTNNTASLLEQKRTIQASIDEINSNLYKKTVIENTQKRITELEALEKKLNQEIADLERKEFLQKSFEYAKNEAYQSRINEMFSLVKFNLFRQQVDGQIVPTCECHVNGVPYSTQNNAMQVAMGLDIINTISLHEGVYAPIFIDNRESVTSIPVIEAQIINLVVDSTQPTLTIKY